MPKPDKPAAENAPAYLKLDTDFRPGYAMTPTQITQTVSEMKTHLEGKAEKEKLDKNLLALLGGNVSAMEAVAKKHEGLAMLISAHYLQNGLTKAGFELDPERNLGEQVAELCEQEKFRTIAAQNAMNPLFRKGLHAVTAMASSPEAGQSTPASRKLVELEEQINNSLMERTLQPPTDAQIQSLQQELVKQGKGEQTLHALLVNQEQQRAMAKMLFMGHLAGVRVTENGQPVENQNSMSEFYVHGGRVTVTLPAGDQQERQFDAILGKNIGDTAGVYGRVFATHGVDNATLNDDGSVKTKTREYKPSKFKFKTDIHKNYGMDIAVGGIGNRNAGGGTVTGNGQNGHVYMKLMAGGGKTCGAMLFGIESSAPGKSSQLGQSHNMKATKSKQSPFLSHKQAPGDAYAGREIDFSQMDGSTFINLMDRFDAYYRELQNDPERQEELRDLNKNLCGKPMTPELVKGLMTDKMGVEAQTADAVYSQLRTAHVKPAERVQVAAQTPVPPRPNIFKRWFSGINAAWREENERYERYVQEQQTERLKQRKAMEDALSKVPENWDQGEQMLGDYINNLSLLEGAAKTEYDKQTAYAKAVLAVNYTLKSGAVENLSKQNVTPELIDESRAMNDPAFIYMLNNRETDLQKAMASIDPAMGIYDMVRKVGDDFRMNEAEWAAKKPRIKQLYDKLNVPNLESRSKEYRNMVAAVGKMALNEKYDPVAAIQVFNTVQNYANEKSDVPSTDLGKESLKLAYDSLKAALPEKKTAALVKPMEQKMTRLQNAMQQPEFEEAAIEKSNMER